MKLLCRLLGHKYEPRFSIYLGPPTLPSKRPRVINGPHSYTQVLESSRERRETYICDICSRCGDVVMCQEPELDLAEMSGKGKPKPSRFKTVHSRFD